MSDSEARGEPLLESLSDSSTSQRNPTQKRKRKQGGSEPQPKDAAAAKPSAKRRKLKKPKDIDDAALDAELGVNLAVARMDGGLLADHLAQRTRRFRPELSLVEMEDLHLPEKAIHDTTAYSSSPRTIDHLTDFLEHFAGSKKRKQGLRTAPAEKGHPHTLVVAGAGLRAAELARALRKFQSKDALVAKLFAKHIKLQEAVERTRSCRIGIGVGTPQRVIDLLEDGALSAASLERIVIDASHIDLKKRGMLDMKETLVPLISLLTRPELKARYSGGSDRIDLLFF